MRVWIDNIERETKRNSLFRRVVRTGKRQQLVFMSIAPKSEIGLERHPNTDQFLRIEKGRGVFVYSYAKAKPRVLHKQQVEEGFAMFVPAGVWHNVVNSSPSQALQLYTLYAPPEHAPGLRQRRKPVG